MMAFEKFPSSTVAWFYGAQKKKMEKPPSGKNVCKQPMPLY